MPTVVVEAYKFRFSSSAVTEPPYFHVFREGNHAKIWLQSLAVETHHGYNQTELNRIVRLMRYHQSEHLEIWNAHFSK